MIDPKRKGSYRVMCGGVEVIRGCRYSPALGFRMKGLLGRKELGEQDGILLLPCNSIHMWFMSISIDAFFLNKAGKIVALYESIKPWRISGLHWDSHSVLETQAGKAQRLGIKRGDSLNFEVEG